MQVILRDEDRGLIFGYTVTVKRKQQRGIILGIAIIVTVLLLVMGTAVATMGTGNLNTALVSLNTEKAYQVAEAGVALGVNDLRMSATAPITNGTIRTYRLASGDAAEVTFYHRDPADTASPKGCPVELPSGHYYVHSKATVNQTSQAGTARAAGCVCILGRDPNGLSQAFTVQELSFPQGEIGAFDRSGNLELTKEVIAATNRSTPGTFHFGNGSTPVVLKGDIQVPQSAVPSQVFSDPSGQSFLAGSVKSGVTSLTTPKIVAPQVALADTSTPGSPGHYDTLVLDRQVPFNGTYVVDRLVTEPGAKFMVPIGAAVTIYVRKWEQNSPDPIFYNSNSANHLKIFYAPTVGSERPTLRLPVNSDSFSLVAPEANVELLPMNRGKAYGSVAAYFLKIAEPNNSPAKFYYDPVADQPLLQPPSSRVITSESGGSNFDEVLVEFTPVTVLGHQRF